MHNIAARCRGIKKSYGTGEFKIEALKGIDIDFYESELTLIVGPSGSGKSTLLSILIAILTPDEGQIFLLDQDLNQLSENDRAKFCHSHLGIVFQSLFLIPTLTVAENVALPLLIAGCKESIAHERALEVLKSVNMDKRASTSPALLSKGQQQRVAIARALVNDSKIIVCDEPTSALDQTAGHEIMVILRDLAVNKHKAVLVVTHDHRTFPFADRIITMEDGQIIPGEPK